MVMKKYNNILGDKVKKIVGVAYEQMDGEKEPNLEKLKLELRTK